MSNENFFEASKEGDLGRVKRLVERGGFLRKINCQNQAIK